MAILAKLKTILDENNIKYEIISHPVAYTAQELAHAERVSGKNHAKVVMVKTDGTDVMAVLPATHRLDLAKLGALLGKPVRLATETEFKFLFPDCDVGAMPPFGNLYGVPVYVDEALARCDFIVFQGGTHTDAVKMSYKDFAQLVKPTMAAFGVPPTPPKT